MFRDPRYLTWMIASAAAAGFFWFWGARQRRRMTAIFGNPKTVARLMGADTTHRRKIKTALRLAALILVCLALSGPQWGVELVATDSKASQAMVAVDVSLSMMTPDVKPSRLEKAKSELSLILDQLRGERVGIIAFAGEAAVLCPLTTDIDAAKQVLSSLEIGAIPQPGTGIGKAIRLADQALARYPGGKSIILLSDGEDHKTDPAGAAAEAAGLGIKIYSVGIGTPEGEPIPIKDESGALTGYKKDRKGSTVISRLGEQTLRQAAADTGGAYYRSSPGENEAQEIVSKVSAQERGDGLSGRRTQYKNRFMIPLALALLLLLIELCLAERSKVSVLEYLRPQAKTAASSLGLLLLALALPRASQAGAESSLRSGNKLYKQEKYIPALENYSQSGKRNPSDPRPIFNSGDALYRMEQYDQSAQAFSALTRPQLPPELRSAAFYNLGDILIQKQQIKEAIAAYRDAVTLNPKDPAARHNLAVALRMLKNPDKKNQKKNEPKKQDDKKGGGEQPKDQPKDSKTPEPRTRPQDQISKEDAERILRAGAEKEKAAQQQMQKRAVQNKAPDVEEDW